MQTYEQLRHLINSFGFTFKKGTPNRWIKEKRHPRPFLQRKIGKLLGAEVFLADDEDELIFVPRKTINNPVASMASTKLDTTINNSLTIKPKRRNKGAA